MPASQYFSTPTPVACFVDSSTPFLPRPYPQHSARSSASRVLSSLKRGLAGVRAQSLGLSAHPTFSVAKSPVSPVDRKRLLTASSSLGCHPATFHSRVWKSPKALGGLVLIATRMLPNVGGGAFWSDSHRVALCFLIVAALSTETRVNRRTVDFDAP